MIVACAGPATREKNAVEQFGNTYTARVSACDHDSRGKTPPTALIAILVCGRKTCSFCYCKNTLFFVSYKTWAYVHTSLRRVLEPDTMVTGQDILRRSSLKSKSS